MLDILLGLGLEFWPYIAGAIGVIAVFFGGKRSGQKKEQYKQKERDYEHANEIRDRVRNDTGDVVRKFDDAGYRD